jgi:hypothetical protein
MAEKGDAGTNGTNGTNGSNGTNGTDLTTTLTAAGDVVYKGASALTRLAKGTADQVLTMNTGATAPEWADAAGGGKVLQVVQTVQPNQVSASTGNAMVDISGMSVSITPASGSKVLVQISFGRLTSGGSSIGVRLLRGSTSIGVGTSGVGLRQALTLTAYQPGDLNHAQGGQSMTYLDNSPGGNGSTAITYKMQWQGQDGNGYMNMAEGNLNEAGVYGGVSISTITVWEIGA